MDTITNSATRTAEFRRFIEAFLRYCESERAAYGDTRATVAGDLVPPLLAVCEALSVLWALNPARSIEALVEGAVQSWESE